MNLITRKVDPTNTQDVRDFNALMAQLSNAAENVKLLRENIEKMNSRDDAYLMVVEDKDNGMLVGSVLGIVIDDFCGDCTPFMVVENAVTHSFYRRKGVGKKMFDDLEDWAREKGARYSFLSSQLYRTEAHQFYPSIGYAETKGFRKNL